MSDKALYADLKESGGGGDRTKVCESELDGRRAAFFLFSLTI